MGDASASPQLWRVPGAIVDISVKSPNQVGLNVYLRDIATIQDDTDITYGYALVNGKKAVYLPIIKKDTGSTLTVVADVRKSMQLFRDAVPKDVKVSFEFDESPTVLAAKARLEEARSILGKYEAGVERWEVEVGRLKREVEHGVVDPQVLLESNRQLKSDIAARDAAKATIKRAAAEVLADEATFQKSKVAVAAANADLSVAISDAKRLEAWVGYLTITAPFDGTVVARNANTFDFVLPGRGDPTADSRSPYLSPSGNAAPIFVVDRTDIVRVFVDIPEKDADYVHIGSRASVLVQAFRDEPIEGTVTRTSWALNVKSRTLRAEIDLTNPLSKLLPGMYAYADVVIERPGIRAIPTAALAHNGGKTYCWLYEDGRVHRTEIRTGITDGEWVEVSKIRRPKGSSGETDWRPVDGTERMVLGDLAGLAENERVRVGEGGSGPKNAGKESPRKGSSDQTREALSRID